MRGAFITLEGIEGCGKTTQSRHLAAHLAALGHDAILTREPGGTPFADALRAVLLDPASGDLGPEAELLLVTAARADHVRRVIEPALASGRHVICDRFSDSTHAYQGAARGLDAKVIEAADRIARGSLEPDLTLLLDMPAEAALDRALTRNAASLTRSQAERAARSTPGPEGSRLDDEDIQFHRRVRSGFLRRAGEHPHRIWVVDASSSEQEISLRINGLVSSRLAALAP